MDQNSDIEAWRRVHRKLTLALIQSRDNIAAELTKRRYLLEEMNRCKMQNIAQKSSTPGNSGGAKAKKKASVKKAPPPQKERVPATAAPKTQAAAEILANTAVEKAQLKTPGMVHESTGGEQSTAGGGAAGACFNSADAQQPSLQYAPQQMGQMFYSSSRYGIYGNMGLDMATPEQVGMALQMLQSNATMLQQMNQSNATIDGESDSDA
jgi:hypothetical protein